MSFDQGDCRMVCGRRREQQVDDIHGQLSAVQLAQHAYVKEGGDGALFRAAAQGKRVVSVTKK